MKLTVFLLLLYLQPIGPVTLYHFPTKSLYWVQGDSLQVPGATNQSIRLSSSEIELMKALMTNSRRSYNRKQSSRQYRIQNLCRYQYQCYAYVDSNENRMVIVQGLLGKIVDTEHFTMVLDGGNSVIHFSIDITHRNIIAIGINGFG